MSVPAPADDPRFVGINWPAAHQPRTVTSLPPTVASDTEADEDPGGPTRSTPFDLERDTFWNARPELSHIRDFARARRAAPWAVLGCTLARVIAHVEPFVTLPPIVGGDASLNLFLGLVGPSGGGKGAAESAAKDAFSFAPPTAEPLTEVGIGSGEGIAHTYLRHVPGKGKERGHMEQHTTRALFRAPEVDTLAALKGRQGSTLLPKLRDAWIGDALGFAYADTTRRLDLAPHKYRLCLIVGIQPARASVLLGDADGGTPQRFLWMPTQDHNIPPDRPREPASMKWRHPRLDMSGHGRHRLHVCDDAWRAIDQAAVDRHRGDVEALDGHALLSRLKTAAALGVLNGHADVTADDWQLAGTVMAISDRTRGRILTELTARREQATIARGRSDGLRDSVAAEVRATETAKRVGKTILRRLTTDWIAGADLRRAIAYRDRDHVDEALDTLVSAGLVDTEDIDPQGTPGARYRLAKGVPS